MIRRTPKKRQKRNPLYGVSLLVACLFVGGSYAMFITTDQVYASLDTSITAEDLRQEISDLESEYHEKFLANSVQLSQSSEVLYARISGAALGMRVE